MKCCTSFPNLGRAQNTNKGRSEGSAPATRGLHAHQIKEASCENSDSGNTSPGPRGPRLQYKHGSLAAVRTLSAREGPPGD